MALLTVKQFSRKHHAFPEGGLRWRIFHADENGLAACGAILRDGTHVLIHEERFFARLDALNGIRPGADKNLASGQAGMGAA